MLMGSLFLIAVGRRGMFGSGFCGHENVWASLTPPEEGRHIMSSTPRSRDPRDESDYSADRTDLVARQQEQYGGVKVGAAFFGWLTALGMAVILTALLAAVGTAVGIATNTTPEEATSDATQSTSTVGIVGAIALGVILFVAYYCGGYVAGRMARFNGAKQGLAVWVWALVIAILIAVLGAVAGSKYNVLEQLNSFPRIPVSEGDLTTAGIVALIIVAVTSLVGAILGGIAGTRYHRRIDEVDLDA
jgi:hypothetical protein